MALREIIARFGFQVDQSGLRKAQTGVGALVSGLKGLGVALGAGIVARGIKNFVTGMVDAGDALGKTSTQLGLSGKELQAWQTAANFAGVQTESLNQGFRILGKNALLAQQGSKQAADAFKILGVEIEGANGNLKPANQLAREAGVALGEMEDRTKAVGLAQQVFGRAGAALLPLFAKGAEGLDEALAKLEEFGGGLSDDLIPLAEAAQDRFTEFEIATTSLKAKFAVALLPILNQVVLGLSKLISWISKSSGSIESFKVLVGLLAALLAKAAIGKFGAALLRLGRAAILPLLKFALLFLVVDDLIALFEGRGSVIGDTIDKIFGKGSAKKVVDAIKAVGKAALDAVTTGNLEKLDKALEDLFGPPGEELVKFIVEDIPAATNQLTQQILKGFVTNAKALAGFLATFAGMVADGFVANAKAIGKAALDLGKAYIDGVVDGVKAGAKAIVGAVTSTVQGAIDAGKALLKPGSPSRVAREELGKPFAEGIFDVQAAKSAARAFAATVSAPMPGIASSVSASPRGASGGTGGVVFQSTINLTVSGGSASDPQIQKLRQGVRSELRDNRRATLEALTQNVEVPA